MVKLPELRNAPWWKSWRGTRAHVLVAQLRKHLHRETPGEKLARRMAGDSAQARLDRLVERGPVVGEVFLQLRHPLRVTRSGTMLLNCHFSGTCRPLLDVSAPGLSDIIIAKCFFTEEVG